MDDRFFHGIIGCEVVVCGQRLRDLTPWHILILNAIESPVISDGGEIRPQDLIVFLKVAKSNYPELPDLTPKARDIPWLLKLLNKNRFTKQVDLLVDWIGVQMSAPILYEVTYDKNSARKSLSSPSIFALVMAIANRTNERLRDLWNMRVSELRWADVVLAELNGAELTISYEGEEVADEFKELSEDEIISIAKKDLPPKLFDQWLKNRRENRKK